MWSLLRTSTYGLIFHMHHNFYHLWMWIKHEENYANLLMVSSFKVSCSWLIVCEIVSCLTLHVSQPPGVEGSIWVRWEIDIWFEIIYKFTPCGSKRKPCKQRWESRKWKSRDALLLLLCVLMLHCYFLDSYILHFDQFQLQQITTALLISWWSNICALAAKK